MVSQIFAFSCFHFFANYISFWSTFWRDTIIIYPLNDQKNSQKVVVNHTEKFVTRLDRYSHFQVSGFSQFFSKFLGILGDRIIIDPLNDQKNSQKVVVNHTEKFVHMTWQIFIFSGFPVFVNFSKLFGDILERQRSSQILSMICNIYIESSCEPH